MWLWPGVLENVSVIISVELQSAGLVLSFCRDGACHQIFSLIALRVFLSDAVQNLADARDLKENLL